MYINVNYESWKKKNKKKLKNKRLTWEQQKNIAEKELYKNSVYRNMPIKYRNNYE